MKHFGEGHPHLGVVYNALRLVHSDQKNFEKAIGYGGKKHWISVYRAMERNILKVSA